MPSTSARGSNTVIAQLFATALRIPVADLEIIGADTDLTPDAGKTSASRQTYVSGNAARLAGEELRRRVLKLRNASDSASLEFGSGGIRMLDAGLEHFVDLSRMPADGSGYVLSAEETYDPPVTALDPNGQGVPYAQYGFAAHVALVEVDASLGLVRPLRFWAAHDVGRVVNPMLAEGQVHGGIAQGLGMALMEEYIPGRTENLHDYLIPSIGDIPPIETIFIEEPDPHGPFRREGTRRTRPDSHGARNSQRDPARLRSPHRCPAGNAVAGAGRNREPGRCVGSAGNGRKRSAATPVR